MRNGSAVLEQEPQEEMIPAPEAIEEQPQETGAEIVPEVEAQPQDGVEDKDDIQARLEILEQIDDANL